MLPFVHGLYVVHPVYYSNNVFTSFILLQNCSYPKKIKQKKYFNSSTCF